MLDLDGAISMLAIASTISQPRRRRTRTGPASSTRRRLRHRPRAQGCGIGLAVVYLVILTARIDDIRDTISWLATNNIRHDWLICAALARVYPSTEWKAGQPDSPPAGARSNVRR